MGEKKRKFVKIEENGPKKRGEIGEKMKKWRKKRGNWWKLRKMGQKRRKLREN